MISSTDEYDRPIRLFLLLAFHGWDSFAIWVPNQPPGAGGGSLHNSNVAERAPDVRQYRFPIRLEEMKKRWGNRCGPSGDPIPLQVNHGKAAKTAHV
jgi:hypothetical protein